jgi:glutathione synthase/RimK-type ligase-like ATP-grasp enzyme
VSLVFLGGRFSHAVRKTPKAGDFRVQEEHGGTRERTFAKPEWVSEAERVLARLPPMVYARVDVVDTKDGLVWMELEATDPELFFLLVPEAAPRFADAVLAALAKTPERAISLEHG